MYYHVRIDKILHNGCIDIGARVEWNFRLLGKALAMIGRDFSADAAYWRIQDITDRTIDIMRLENGLKVALESTCQFIVMTFKDGVAAIGKYDHYEFFIVMRDETECPPTFSFSEKDEASIIAPEVVFEPDVRKDLIDILRSFNIPDKFDYVGKAFEAILEFYCDEEDVPGDVRELKEKKNLTPKDYVVLADECQSCGEDQLAARLYVAGCCTAGDLEKSGEALVKLADLYMNSEWPRNGGREWDVMKAVDLLKEAFTLGCVKEAKETLEGMREQLFEEYEDELDVDYFIRKYQADALCLAAFCLGVGIGWKKDVPSATRLYEAALARGYERATYCLREIHSGRVLCQNPYHRDVPYSTSQCPPLLTISRLKET